MRYYGEPTTKYSVLTSKNNLNACLIEDPEEADAYREALFEEQNEKLALFGYDDLTYNTHLIRFFDSVFCDESVEEMTIDEAIQALALKEGADLVQWESGQIGFIGYYGSYINGFEIIA